MADIQITLRVRGNREVRNALRGIVRATEDAEKQKRRSGQRTVSDTERQERQKRRTSERTEKEVVRATQRSERDKRRESQRTAREFERNERTKSRSAERSARESRRSWARSFSALGGAVGGAAFGVAREASGYAGSLGFQDRFQLAKTRHQAELDWIRLTQKAGYSKDQASSARSKILTASRATGVDATALINAGSVAQGRFADLNSFVSNVGDIAQISQATGGDPAMITNAFMRATQQFNLKSVKDQKAFLGSMIAYGNKGSIEAPQLAENFASVMGHYSMDTHSTGIKGAQQMLAVSEILGMSGASDPENATALMRMTQSLNQAGVQKKIKKQLGFSATDEHGHLIDMFSFFEKLNKSKAGYGKDWSVQKLQGIIPNIRALKGIEPIMKYVAEHPKEVSAIRGTTAQEGWDYVGRTTAALNSSAAGKTDLARAGQVANVIEAGGKLEREFLNMYKPVSDLTSKFPELASASAVARNALLGLAGVSVLSGIKNSIGGAAGAAASGGGALSKVGAVIGAAGAGFGIGALLDHLPGMLGAKGDKSTVHEAISSALSNMLGNGAEAKFKDERGLQKGAQILGSGKVVVPPTIELGPKSLSALQKKLPSTKPGGPAHSTD